jgi:hypothetical protein
MILLMHLLEHMGLPSGSAIAVSIAVMKVAKAAVRAKIGPRGDRADLGDPTAQRRPADRPTAP